MKVLLSMASSLVLWREYIPVFIFAQKQAENFNGNLSIIV
jgi:hypothetical protein